MTNRITRDNFHKLRSGHTVWRCQIMRDGNVSIHEFSLNGRKYIDGVLHSLRIRNKGKKYGGDFLSDVAGYSADIATFTSRRAACRWKSEVEAGIHSKAVYAAKDHWRVCDDMEVWYDDLI